MINLNKNISETKQQDNGSIKINSKNIFILFELIVSMLFVIFTYVVARVTFLIIHMVLYFEILWVKYFSLTEFFGYL